MQPPISMAQTATGTPSARSPGNIRAPNETIFAISSTAATRPTIRSLAKSLALARRTRLAIASRGAGSPTTASVSSITASIEYERGRQDRQEALPNGQLANRSRRIRVHWRSRRPKVRSCSRPCQATENDVLGLDTIELWS